MVVRHNIAKLNDNNCRNIVNLMNTGLNAVEAFKVECKRTRNNYDKLKGIEIRNDKYYWIFALLNLEFQSLQSCC